MRIRRIELDGFGRLEDYSEEFAPGLNVFFGLNEAGKSTLQRAILALLYGFYAGDRKRAHESLAQDGDQPWSDAPYRGRLDYELADGRCFRVDRDFSTPEVATRIYDLTAGGREVTDDYGRGRHGNLRLAMRHLGMPKTVFEACAFISQGELFNIRENARDIGDTIISLADSAGREISAQRALDRLEKIYKEDVGSSRARVAPLPAAQRKSENLVAELAQIDALRAEIAEAAATRDQAQSHAEQIRGEQRRTRYLLSMAQTEELRQMLDQLDNLTRREEQARVAMAEQEEYARFPTQQFDDVHGEWARIEEAEKRLKDTSGGVEEQRRRTETLAAKREGVAREQRHLAHLRQFSVELKPEVDRLAGEWRVARVRVNDAHTSLDAIAHAEDNFAEYESLEVRVGSLTEDDVRRVRARLSAREPGGPLATIFRFFHAFLRLIGRLFAGKAANETRSAADLSHAEAEQLLGERERWSGLRPQVENYRRARAAYELAEAALRQADDALRSVLRGTADDTADLEHSFEVFTERCQGAARLQQIDDQVAAIDREMEALSAAIRVFEKNKEQAQSRRTALTSLLGELTEQDKPLEEGLRAFDEGCARRHKHDEAARELDQTRAQRGMLLGGRSPEEIRRTLADAERAAAYIVTEMPSLRGATTHQSTRDLLQGLERIDDDLRSTELRIMEFTTRIDTQLQKLRPRSEVEEEIERTRREVEKLGSFRDELQIAMDVISAAAEEAHRDFGPRVGRFLSAHMAEVTGGRYREMHLDPTSLELRVEAPETHRLVTIEGLSRGTRAAAYLLLRLGLTQHMSSIHEPVPLILDDPLVDLDDVRLDEFLDLLLRLSEETQILLFTKDSSALHWFERHCAESPPHKLTVLQAPLPDASIAPAPLAEPALTNGSSEE